MTHRNFSVVALSAALCLAAAPPSRAARVYVIRNASWLTDTGFVSKTMYSANGRLEARRLNGITDTIDLTGQFVIPPYADAHTHAFGDVAATRRASRTHLQEGVYYAMNLLNAGSTRRNIARLVNAPLMVDVSLSSAALTGTRGHPILSTEMLANGWSWDSLGFYWNRLRNSRKAARDSYFEIEDTADVRREWPQIMEGRPDIIKIFLLNSERHARLRADSNALDETGLDPAVVPAIVAAAHRSRRRVAAHIESAHDFHVAIVSGVDIIAHLPGLAVRSAIDSVAAAIAPADAAEAGRRGVTIVPTGWLSTQTRIARGDTSQIARARRLAQRNLALLDASGVRIAVGSDGFASARVEAQYLLSLGLFDAGRVLRMWTDASARVIFPHRRIGKVLTGYEASFLGLRCNPLREFSCTDSIAFYMKQGRVLTVQ